MGLQRHLRLVGSKTEEGVMMSRPLRIAFATDDLQHVNQHFGATRCFAIYTVDEEHAELVEATQFSEHRQDHNEDKLAAKLEMLRQCAAVYCQAVGSSAIHQLLAAGIQPLKVEINTPITRLIADLRSQLRRSPPPWWIKARSGGPLADLDRFDKMEAEGWDE
jgi:nitrogen fixation protein NifX